MKQYYRIADLTVEMDCTGRTESFARPYKIEMCDNPDIVVIPDFEHIKELLPGCTKESCEYLATGISYYKQLLNYNGMMLHSSAVVIDEKAYLFSAPCGTGKSTHVSIWRNVFGDNNVRVLNDDKPALRLQNGVWYAYGTPWSGKTGQNLNIKAKLAGIAVLERSENNEIERLSKVKAVPFLLSQTASMNDTTAYLKQLELLDKLIADIPIWKLRCNMEPEAAIVAYEAMSGEKWRK